MKNKNHLARETRFDLIAAQLVLVGAKETNVEIGYPPNHSEAG